MMRRRSTDIESGITRISWYPFTAATIARPMPVLPEVGSMITESFFSRPFCSASSIIDSAMRSLMLAPGLARSSLIHTSWVEPNSRFTFTWGVLPMVSRMVFARMETSSAQVDEHPL